MVPRNTNAYIDATDKLNNVCKYLVDIYHIR